MQVTVMLVTDAEVIVPVALAIVQICPVGLLVTVT